MDIGLWSGTSVFDAARAIDGRIPDLDLHCERLINSAHELLMHPAISSTDVEALCRDGVRRVGADEDLYLRPMFFQREGLRLPEVGKTEFALSVFTSPMPPEVAGAACLSSFRRPAPDQAPTMAKAGCLYPLSQRAHAEAVERGYQMAVVRGPDGDVAEFSHANLWLAKDGEAITPAVNGSFLNGITRQRVAGLLRRAGITVRERSVATEELAEADEVFVTGNIGKVQAINRYEDRDLQPGPIFRRARALYMDFVASVAPI
ncbi:MAG: branched-chain amino acid aminotransferase [Rhodospirillaceae bacterium]|nr:branched-chain amino acid aminotransferase [Rhodospirillaceae bacterium]